MQRSSLLHPPPFVPSLTLNKVFRFKASAAMVNDVLSIKDVGTMLIMATGATTSNTLSTAFRLRKVEMWGPMASDLVPVTVSVEFQFTPTSGLGGPSKLQSDTSMGSTVCAHVSAVPPAGSSASFWQADYTTDGMCLLNGPSNSVVDLTIEYTLNDSLAAGTAVTVVAATAGVIYVRKPDVSSTAVLVPISFPTI